MLRFIISFNGLVPTFLDVLKLNVAFQELVQLMITFSFLSIQEWTKAQQL
jgi:hypothetical protein